MMYYSTWFDNFLTEGKVIIRANLRREPLSGQIIVISGNPYQELTVVSTLTSAVLAAGSSFVAYSLPEEADSKRRRESWTDLFEEWGRIDTCWTRHEQVVVTGSETTSDVRLLMLLIAIRHRVATDFPFPALQEPLVKRLNGLFRELWQPWQKVMNFS